ncbi:MAG: tetratricopeptide repeat protein [Myxococcales bacterium]|nr:tetratricopeptide repeat protein [Myxococcales bacterium]MCB9713813.1 tetratricopeptide repeat protein [Myxococcales bacterium]
MPAADELPLQEVLQALSSTPRGNPQLRAALATTCARWLLLRGDEDAAVGHLGHALEMVPDLRPAMRLLYRIFRGRGDVRSAVAYLDQEIRATRHPREAAALYRERGQLVEAHFHDLAAAQQCYQAALKATPRDLAVLRAVERVCLARGEVFQLIANLEAQLEVVRDPALTAGVLHDLALLEARHKGDLALAGDLVLAALAIAPGHLLLATDLFRLAEAAGDSELMLHALEIEAESRPPERRALPLARAAVTLREQRERAGALLLLEAAAQAQPHNASLWRSLEELAMATSRHDIALEACVGQLRAVGDEEDPAARAELFYRMGKLALFRLDRANEGLAAMRKALRLNPSHIPAIEDTGRFLNANGMWAQLLELIKLEIASAPDAGLTREELALAHLRAGQLMEERLGELDGARECYENAIAAHPSFRPACDRLERILHHQGDLTALRRYYADELSRAKTPARRSFLLSVLGQLHARDDDPNTAIKYLANLLKEDPKHLPSLQVLARILSRAGRPRELLKVTEQEIALTDSPGRKAKLLHRCGELALSLGERDKARECFELALDAVDDHLPSLDMLGKLVREDEDWEGLVTLLRTKLLYANDRARQVGLQLEVATLLASRLERKPEALAELTRLLERWPRHLPALHAAESLATSLGEHDKLLELLEQHIAAVTGPRTRALLLHRASLVRTQLGDDDGAVRDLVRALELWPQLGVARAGLLRLYERLGRSRELQAFAEAGLTSERGADDRRAMALQLAELSPKPVVAIQYLGAVAEARPEDYVTQLRLARACRQAGRPSREAGALQAAANVFGKQLPPEDPHLLALRYRAARAEEAAGNLDQADAAYASILDHEPGHLLATRGRQRIKTRKKEAGLTRSAKELEAAAAATSVAAEQAAYLTIAADLHERRQDLESAMRSVDAALRASPGYLPALHARARLLERQGIMQPGADAMETLVTLAQHLASPAHRARALCRAGTLALGRGKRGEPNPQAWTMFSSALVADPGSDRAFRGLRRTLVLHGREGAPPLSPTLTARLDRMRERDVLGPASLRDLARLAAELEGPEQSVTLLRAGLDLADDDAGVHVDLAQAYGRLGRWSDAVQELEAALARELSPERKAALHFFAGDAHHRAGNSAAAVPHLLAAGQGGYHPKHALTAADRIAAKVGDLAHRVEALQLLVEIGDGPERVSGLRSLAQLHSGPLGQPDVAVERMRELLLLRPTDLDVITELWRLLESLGRHDEATAVLLAGVAHHRAWLRSSGLSADGPATMELSGEPVAGLLHLFRAMGERDGVYLASAVLEVVDPDLVPEGLAPDELVTEPWALPEGQEGRPFDGLVGDLPASSALDLLREGAFFLGHLPGTTAPREEITQRPLPPNSAVVMVTRALSDAMGVPLPRVFVDPDDEDEVRAYLAGTPCLVVGRRINGAPFGAPARDAIGRALLRLSTGGDALHRELAPAQLSAVLLALSAAAGVEIDDAPEHDAAYLGRVQEALAEGEPSDLVDLAVAFAETIETFDPNQLLETLHVAEDRAGAVCAADPRPRLLALAAQGQLAGPRGSSVVGYLLSDDHLTLRHSLGYLTEIAAPIRREEEPSA